MSERQKIVRLHTPSGGAMFGQKNHLLRVIALMVLAASGFASGKNREMTMALSGIRANHFHRDLILKIMRAKGAMG